MFEDSVQQGRQGSSPDWIHLFYSLHIDLADVLLASNRSAIYRRAIQERRNVLTHEYVLLRALPQMKESEADEMTETQAIRNKSTRCRVCDGSLQIETEQMTHICFKCRRYGLLNGRWPETNTASVLPVPLTQS